MRRYGCGCAFLGAVLGGVAAFAVIMHKFSLTNPGYATDGIGVTFAAFICAPIGAILGGLQGYYLGRDYDRDFDK